MYTAWPALSLTSLLGALSLVMDPLLFHFLWKDDRICIALHQQKGEMADACRR